MLEIDNHIAYLKEENEVVSYVTFPLVEKNTVDIKRVYTNINKRGHGFAKVLMDGLYEYLKENNLKVIATCPYAIAYFEKYPQKKDILK